MRYELKEFFGRKGFVTQWLVCGPFPNETEANPEPYLFEPKISKFWHKDWLKSKGGETNIRPRAGQSVNGPKNFLRKWIPIHVKFIHWFEIHKFYSLYPHIVSYLNENCKSKCWDEWDAITYLSTYIEVNKSQDVIIYIGSWDGYKLWVNNKFIGEEHSYHHALVDHKKHIVHFNKGLNLILIKMDRRRVCLRITSLDGSPISAKVVLPSIRNTVTLGDDPLSPFDKFRKITHFLKPEMSCPLDNKSKILKWQEKFREKLINLILPSGLPKDKIKVKILENVDEDKYIRRKILYWRRDSITKVPAYVLIPKKPNGKAMICLHGHNGGRDCGKRGPVGVPLDQYQADMIKQDNYDYARQFALRGYTTITPDAIGFGERKGMYLSDKDLCDVINTQANFLGMNLFGLDIFDYIGAVDYLVSLPYVNLKKIGCVGLSFGGTSTYLLSAIDKRISLAIVSCALTSFKEYIQDTIICGSQTIYGILKYGDIVDICCLIAPRPLLIENGRLDSCFSILYAEDAYNKLKKVYNTLGEANKINADFFEAGHRFNGVKAFDWADKWL
jgi:dienelactone hydrolase